MTYYVFTVADPKDDCGIIFKRLDQYATKRLAMQVAKKAAAPRSSDCVPYGPTSIAYVGPHVTAVVSW